MLKLIYISALLLSVGTLSLSSCGNHNQPTDAPNEVKTDSSAHAAYLCPMGYECGHSMEPGKCQSCGMELKKNEKYKAN